MRGTWGTRNIVGIVRKSGLGTFVVVEDGVRGGIGSGERVVAEAGGFAELGVGETLALAVEDEFRVVDEGHAVGLGELFGAWADKVDVLTLFEDQARGLNGIAKTLDACDATSLHATAVHEESIELDTAIRGEKAATAGVEGGVVFKDGDGGFDGIECGCSTREKSVAGFKGVANTGQVSGSGVGGNGPCATVNDESRGVGGSSHLIMLVHSASRR